MIWGYTSEEIETYYRQGQAIFAWLPTRMTGGKWVWFELYWVALHRGPNNRRWWVRELTCEAAVQQFPSAPPKPKGASVIRPNPNPDIDLAKRGTIEQLLSLIEKKALKAQTFDYEIEQKLHPEAYAAPEERAPTGEVVITIRLGGVEV